MGSGFLEAFRFDHAAAELGGQAQADRRKQCPRTVYFVYGGPPVRSTPDPAIPHPN